MQLLVPGGRTSCLKKVKRSHVWIWYQLLCYFYPKGRCIMCILFIFVMCNPTCLSLGYFSPKCSDFNFVLSRYQTPRNSPIAHQDQKNAQNKQIGSLSKIFTVRNRWVNPIKSLTKRPGNFIFETTQAFGGQLKWSLQSSRVSPAPRLSPCVNALADSTDTGMGVETPIS